MTCYLDLPREEVEIFSSADHGTTGINIYDVLPRFLWSSFQNKITVDDYVVRQIYLGDEEDTFFLQIFQVTKALVKAKTYVQMKRYQLGPGNIVEGASGDNQMELALSSIIGRYRTEVIPEKGTELPISQEDLDQDEADFVVDPDWYNNG